MMKIVLTLTIFLATTHAYAMPQDSIGSKVINGKRYLMHKVVKGDGVYGLAKKYKVSANEIFAANEGSEKSIKIDQVLLIPRSFGNTAQTKPTEKPSQPNAEKLYHTVVKGNTLSAIAKQYNTTIDNIKTLNNLPNENIQLGQKLLVNNGQTTQETPKKEIIKTTQDDHAVADVEVTKTDNTVVVEVAKPEVKEETEKVVNKYTTIDGDEVTENGLAVISSEGDLYQERSFILHPTAKVGTIVMITNPVNNTSVFARVVGTCNSQDGVVLKMSKTVAHKLGISNDTQVKVSYAK
jgi:LysM repeat protein